MGRGACRQADNDGLLAGVELRLWFAARVADGLDVGLACLDGVLELGGSLYIAGIKASTWGLRNLMVAGRVRNLIHTIFLSAYLAQRRKTTKKQKKETESFDDTNGAAGVGDGHFY